MALLLPALLQWQQQHLLHFHHVSEYLHTNTYCYINTQTHTISPKLFIMSLSSSVWPWCAQIHSLQHLCMLLMRWWMGLSVGTFLKISYLQKGTDRCPSAGLLPSYLPLHHQGVWVCHCEEAVGCRCYFLLSVITKDVGICNSRLAWLIPCSVNLQPVPFGR